MNQSQQNKINHQKKIYQSPQIKKYGKLADLTFNTVGSGIDSIVGGPQVGP